MIQSERLALRTRSGLRRAGLFTLAVLIVACGSSTDAPAGVAGVWAGQIAYLTPNDSFTFSLGQDGSVVEGWGFVRPAGSRGAANFGGTGTLMYGQLDLSLLDLRQLEPPVGPVAQYYLRGPLDHGQLNVTFGILSATGADSAPHTITLRRVRPAASELAGTWVLTSTPNGPVQPGSRDTIIANADGRAWRYLELYTFGGPGISQPWIPYDTRAVWSRRGDWLVIDHETTALAQDSLLIQSGELRRITASGTATDHYTRVSSTARLP